MLDELIVRNLAVLAEACVPGVARGEDRGQGEPVRPGATVTKEVGASERKGAGEPGKSAARSTGATANRRGSLDWHPGSSASRTPANSSSAPPTRAAEGRRRPVLPQCPQEAMGS